MAGILANLICNTTYEWTDTDMLVVLHNPFLQYSIY